ncbi:MAG TPA: hypothetical protein VM118_14060, partial [Acidobacteriota bacterium]|nr:hypothetical protein [Acidobacteriota bacterium]
VAEPNTAGLFSESVVQTNTQGIATVTFTATEEGTVNISARAEGAAASLSRNVTIEKGGGTSEFGQIVLTITPSLIQADGLSTAVVTALVSDPQGNPILDSTVVRFAAGEKFVDVNGDGIWSINIDSLVYDMDGDDQWDAIGSIEQVAYTTSGSAVTNYTAGNTTGLVYIKATAGSPGLQVSADISLSLTSGDSINSIALTPTWQQMQVQGTGGIEWAPVVAQAYDAHGNSAPEGLAIEFLITAGPGGGENVDGDPVGPVTVFTNSLGEAKVTIHAGNQPGTVRLLARSGPVVSAATQVAIRSGPPAFISLGAEDCNVPSWDVVNYTNKITSLVVDQWGNEVPDSTSVWFGTEQGLIEGENHTFEARTFRGVAESMWHSGKPKDDGFVYYWCETSGGTVADTSYFFESGLPGGGSFIEYPDTLLADGTSKGDVVIEVWDGNGVFMDTDYPIKVEADIGTISGGLLGDGCHTSIYDGDYYAGTLDRDYVITVPDSGVGAIATITAQAGGYYGFNNSVEVVLMTGEAYTKRCIIDVPLSVTYGTTVPIEVTILDRWGNPLGGHLIEIVGDGVSGVITGSPAYTNAYGVASGFEFTATLNQIVEDAFITMRDLDPNYGGISKAIKIALEE